MAAASGAEMDAIMAALRLYVTNKMLWRRPS